MCWASRAASGGTAGGGATGGVAGVKSSRWRFAIAVSAEASSWACRSLSAWATARASARLARSRSLVSEPVERRPLRGRERGPPSDVYRPTGPKPVEIPARPAPTCRRAALGPTLVRSPRLETRTRTPGANLSEKPTRHYRHSGGGHASGRPGGALKSGCLGGWRGRSQQTPKSRSPFACGLLAVLSLLQVLRLGGSFDLLL